MGGPSPNAQDVNFAYGEALSAADGLSQLANLINGIAYDWHGKATTAEEGWEGGHHDTFHANLSTLAGDAEAITAALASLAGLFASEWAQAWGEQDRISWARWVRAEKDDDNWAENTVDFFYEEDFGEPPGNPPVPSASDGYARTRAPIHPEHDHTDRRQVDSHAAL